MLNPITYQDWSGGIVDKYVGTDFKRCAKLDNLLIDETGNPLIRYGSFVYQNVLPGSVEQQKPTGLYLGSEPFSHPFVCVGEHGFTLAETGSWSEVLGPAGNFFLPAKTDTTYESAVQWRRQLIACAGQQGGPQLIYCTDFSNPAAYSVLQLGLPSLASVPTISTGGSAHSYGYQFFYKYTFTDYTGTVFEFLGNPNNCQGIATVTDPPDSTPISITSIPVLANTAYTNFDVNNIKILICRTVDGGIQYFQVGTVTNGTTSYSDGLSDADLILNEPIYTSGGALGFDMPPASALYVTQTQDFFWYADKHTLYQSVVGAPSGVPQSTSDQTDQAITGLSNFFSYPILFCDRSVYRVEGVFDSFGNNGFALREISQVAGCVSNQSIVPIPGGLVWFGNGGIYTTDAFQVRRISKHLPTSYQQWANAQVFGRYDPIQNIVQWTVSNYTDSPIPNNIILNLHLNYPILPDGAACFTTWSSDNNLTFTSLGFSSSRDLADAGSPYSTFQNRMCFTDYRGYFLWFDPLALTDARIDSTAFPSAMAKRAIIYDMQTSGLDQGALSFRKYNTQMVVDLDNLSPIALQVQHRRDDGGSWSGTGGSPASGTGATGSPGGGSSGNPGTPEIRDDSALVWGISDCQWANDALEHLWDSSPTISAIRTFPSGYLRSERRQLRFTNAFTIVAGSDYYGTATVSATTKQITLDTYPTQIWPTDPEDYFITFDSDGYNQTFQIQYRLSDQTIQVYDPYGLLISGSQAWEIKGFRKFEKFRLLSFTLYPDDDGQTFSPSTSPVGANAS